MARRVTWVVTCGSTITARHALRRCPGTCRATPSSMAAAFAGSRLAGRASASSTARAGRASTRTAPSTGAGAGAARRAKVGAGRPAPTRAAPRTSSSPARTGPAVAGACGAFIRCPTARPSGRPAGRGPGGRPAVAAIAASLRASRGAPSSPALAQAITTQAGRSATLAARSITKKPISRASSPSASTSTSGCSGVWCAITEQVALSSARTWSGVAAPDNAPGCGATRRRR